MRCPLCNDENQLSVQPTKGRWHCHNCSDADHWHSAADYVMQREHLTYAEAADWLRSRYGTSTTSAPAKATLTALKADAKPARAATTCVSYFDYADEANTPLFRVKREQQGSDKRISQYRCVDGRYVKGLGDVRRVLYRLPELNDAPPERTVFMAEGEKCVYSLESAGQLATTNPGGVGMGWRDEYSTSLAGRDVVILPDCDESGRKHAQKIAGALHGVAARVRLVDLDPALGHAHGLARLLPRLRPKLPRAASRTARR
jgi:hypothetical protein